MGMPMDTTIKPEKASVSRALFPAFRSFPFVFDSKEEICRFAGGMPGKPCSRHGGGNTFLQGQCGLCIPGIVHHPVSC